MFKCSVMGVGLGRTRRFGGFIDENVRKCAHRVTRRSFNRARRACVRKSTGGSACFRRFYGTFVSGHPRVHWWIPTIIIEEIRRFSFRFSAVRLIEIRHADDSRTRSNARCAFTLNGNCNACPGASTWSMRTNNLIRRLIRSQNAIVESSDWQYTHGVVRSDRTGWFVVPSLPPPYLSLFYDIIVCNTSDHLG